MVEMGRPPVKGMVIIQSAAWVPEYVDGVQAHVPAGMIPGVNEDEDGDGDVVSETPPAIVRMQSSDGAVSVEVITTQHTHTSYTPYTPYTHHAHHAPRTPYTTSPSYQPDSLNYLLRLRACCLWPLPTITASNKITLQQLKEQLLEYQPLCFARQRAEGGGRHDPLGVNFRRFEESDVDEGNSLEEPIPDDCLTLADLGVRWDQLRIRRMNANRVPGE